jgi:hypothetical protein
MPIDSHLPQADPFSLVPTFNGGNIRNKLDGIHLTKFEDMVTKIIYD